MASEAKDNEADQAEASHAPRECMACRGGGQVISNLGGTPNTVTCPWCEGSGVRREDIDAQAKWPLNAPPPAEAQPPSEPAAESPSEPATGSSAEPAA